MIDRYTKAVLTVIAAALTAIAAQGLLPTAAGAQFGDGCGNRHNPCYIDYRGAIPGAGFPVTISDF